MGSLPVGTALQNPATMTTRIVSVVLKPVVMTELADDQPPTVMRSENQYKMKVVLVQVLFSYGTGS